MKTIGTSPRSPLARPAPGEDLTHLRPAVRDAISRRTRVALPLAAGAVGVAVAAVAAPAAAATLTWGTVAAGLLTAVAANWSTCGMSVAAVVAAPKQPEREGSSTPARRLGWHALGSILTAVPTGALIGAVGVLAAGAVDAAWAVTVWSLIALLYGLSELGALRMPTPMRRRQLPRHLRRGEEPWKVAFVFGTLIGPGFLIFIRSSAYYLLVLGLLLVGDPLLGAALFATVSLGRCLPSLLAMLHLRSGGSLPGFLSLMCVVDRRVQVLTGAGLVGLAAFAVTASVL
jgi:hypothetical protein